jgi:hypothetical protein
MDAIDTPPPPPPDQPPEGDEGGLELEPMVADERQEAYLVDVVGSESEVVAVDDGVAGAPETADQATAGVEELEPVLPPGEDVVDPDLFVTEVEPVQLEPVLADGQAYLEDVTDSESKSEMAGDAEFGVEEVEPVLPSGEDTVESELLVTEVEAEELEPVLADGEVLEPVLPPNEQIAESDVLVAEVEAEELEPVLADGEVLEPVLPPNEQIAESDVLVAEVEAEELEPVLEDEEGLEPVLPPGEEDPVSTESELTVTDDERSYTPAEQVPAETLRERSGEELTARSEWANEVLGAQADADAGERKQLYLSGHGALVADGSYTTVPEGHTFTLYVPLGSYMDNRLGNAVESGEDLAATTADDGQIFHRATFHPGEPVADLTLYPPHGLDLAGNPKTVTQPTRLSEMWGADDADLHWVACTEVVDHNGLPLADIIPEIYTGEGGQTPSEDGEHRSWAGLQKGFASSLIVAKLAVAGGDLTLVKESSPVIHTAVHSTQEVIRDPAGPVGEQPKAPREEPDVPVEPDPATRIERLERMRPKNDPMPKTPRGPRLTDRPSRGRIDRGGH